jgi:hypothetical protein
MKKSMVLSKSGRHLATSVVALLAIFYAVNFAQRPLYNWDMVAYIAVALIDSGQPADTAYRASHEAIARSVPPAVAELLKDTRNEHLIAADETRFAALLPFFTVKPVYPARLAFLPSDASRALLPAYLLLTIVFIQACAELKTASVRP